MFASSGFPPMPDGKGMYSASSAGKLLGFPSCSHKLWGQRLLIHFSSRAYECLHCCYVVFFAEFALGIMPYTNIM